MLRIRQSPQYQNTQAEINIRDMLAYLKDSSGLIWEGRYGGEVNMAVNRSNLRLMAITFAMIKWAGYSKCEQKMIDALRCKGINFDGLYKKVEGEFSYISGSTMVSASGVLGTGEATIIEDSGTWHLE